MPGGFILTDDIYTKILAGSTIDKGIVPAMLVRLVPGNKSLITQWGRQLMRRSEKKP